MVQAVTVVVGGDQLEHSELSTLGRGQVDGKTQARGGREGNAQPVALTSSTPPAFTSRHVLQHVSLHQA